VIAAADNTVQDDCLSYNGQYGFQSSQRNGFGKDSLTGGPYNVNIKNNEIDFNDTCDWEGTLNNSAVGWTNYNPVPAANRPSDCGTVNPNGNSGGFKLWQTNGVTISGNYIHDNYGPGGWVDTDNANTTFDSNYISGNDDDAIIEEISYNFSITNNTLVKNDIIGGLANAGFPQPAIYVSESGSDTTFGGIPACGETSCSDQSSYKTQSVISGNVLTDNGGGVFLWSDSNRYCSDGFDDGCTLVDGGASGPFTEANCTTNWPAASENTTTWAGNTTGSPAEDWYDGCLWKTENVSVTSNTINFTPANLTLNGSGVCNSTDWSDCGANGVFSEYGSPPNKQPGWVIPTAITFHQGNSWSSNTYNGPSTFYAWNQGNGDNPVSWANWTGATSGGDECSSSGEQTSGACTGPFGQDSGSTFNGSGTSSAPAVSTSAATGVTSSGATLNGTVNPEGQSTTYQFDYGTTTSYGSSTPSPAGSAGSGSTAVSESATLTGLTANTTYHYRIEATNATGTTFGSDQTFTTSASGGSAVSFDAAASGGNTGSRSLSWTQAVSGSSRAIEVGVTVGGDSTQTVTVKDGTTSMTALTGKLNSNNATSGFLQVFGLANPPAGTNTITVTVSGGSVPDAVTGGSISYDGVSQTSPFGTAKTLTGAGIDPSITTTGSTSGDMESGFLSDGSAVASATSGTSRYIVDEDNNTAAGNGAGATAASTGSNVTFTWSDTDDWWAAATVEVQHA
jgi:hypothetical protein